MAQKTEYEYLPPHGRYGTRRFDDIVLERCRREAPDVAARIGAGGEQAAFLRRILLDGTRTSLAKEIAKRSVYRAASGPYCLDRLMEFATWDLRRGRDGIHPEDAADIVRQARRFAEARLEEIRRVRGVVTREN